MKLATKKITKQVRDMIRHEFPSYNQEEISGIMHLINYVDGKPKNWEQDCQNILSDEKNPPYSDNDKNEVILAIMLTAARDICQDQEMMDTIRGLAKKFRDAIKRKRNTSDLDHTNTRGAHNSQSKKVALSNSR